MDESLDSGADKQEEVAAPTLLDALDDQFGFDEAGNAPAEASSAPADAPAESLTPVDAKQAPTEPIEKAAEPAKPDPNAELYAPLPEHNPRKTHERFQKLVEGHKEESQKRESAEQENRTIKEQLNQYEQGLQPLREMGFNSPDAVQDLQQFSQYRNALASGNVDAAMGILQAQLNQLALASGRRVEVDPLQSFPDLAQRVSVGDLDERTALELARGRHGQQLREQASQRNQQAEQRQNHEMHAIQHSARAVDQVVMQLMKDPDYKLIEPAILTQLDSIKRNYLPQQWAGEIERVYQTERRFLTAQARPAVRAPQPLRGSGHAGGLPTPNNAEQAALQAMGLA